MQRKQPFSFLKLGDECNMIYGSTSLRNTILVITVLFHYYDELDIPHQSFLLMRKIFRSKHKMNEI